MKISTAMRSASLSIDLYIKLANKMMVQSTMIKRRLSDAVHGDDLAGNPDAKPENSK